MNVERNELIGADESDLSAKHAVRQGAHDALSDIVKYSTLAAILFAGSYIILDKKTINKLKQRWL